MKNAAALFLPFVYALRDIKCRFLLAAFAASALLFLAVYFAVWAPVSREYGRLHNELTDLRQKNSDDASLSRYVDAVNSLSVRYNESEKRLAVSAGQPEISSFVNAAASSGGLALTVDNTAVSDAGVSGYEKFTQEMTVRGSYSALKKFIFMVENMDSMAVIERLRIEREGRGSAGVKAVLKVVIYKKASKAGKKHE